MPTFKLDGCDTEFAPGDAVIRAGMQLSGVNTTMRLT